jgi:hypothetical protein
MLSIKQSATQNPSTTISFVYHFQFYGAMSLVYLAYGVVWLIVSACQWRELLRIQVGQTIV